MKINLRIQKAVILFLIIVFFIFFNRSLLPKKLKNSFYLFSEPIQKVLWETGDKISDFLGTIFEIENLKQENKQLRLTILELLGDNLRIKELEKENLVLRQALDLEIEKELKLEIADIIGKDISQDSILINRGYENGLSKDLIIITQQKILVGRICEVYENFSKVILLSNKESFLDVEIEDKEIEGLIKGKGSFKLWLELIPKEKEIEQGDIVVTSSLSGIYPQGLLVGEVKEVKKQDPEPFQTAIINPFFNIKETKTIFIIIDF